MCTNFLFPDANVTECSVNTRQVLPYQTEPHCLKSINDQKSKCFVRKWRYSSFMSCRCKTTSAERDVALKSCAFSWLPWFTSNFNSGLPVWPFSTLLAFFNFEKRSNGICFFGPFLTNWIFYVDLSDFQTLFPDTEW